VVTGKDKPSFLELTMTQDILVHTEAGVMTITFNRVDKKNSITADMYGAMADALQQAQADAATRVVVFQGHETIFSAGNDIGDFLNKPPAGVNSPVFRFLHGIAAFPKPIIAAVAGPAVGVGTTMLLHCDLVYAGDNAAFSMPFVNLGLCPEAASSLLVPQMLGYHRAAEALLMGEPFMAEAALEVGLANRVVPPTEVNAYALAQARKLAAKPLSALVETKRLMKKGQSALVVQQMAEEGASFGRMLQEPAAKEAFTAFMERRKPDFSQV
jgi:enoyl-CoA hydratase/carnithine racemase